MKALGKLKENGAEAVFFGKGRNGGFEVGGGGLPAAVNFVGEQAVCLYAELQQTAAAFVKGRRRLLLVYLERYSLINI